MITAQRVRELLAYDPETGQFTWLVRRSNGCDAYPGANAGNPDKQGYRRISVDGRGYRAHRLAFLWMTGEWPATRDVDHINGDPSDNRWTNLREATASQNNINKWNPQPNKCGFPGVSRSLKKFKAQIMRNKKAIYLGTFDTAEEAYAAYVLAMHRMGDKFIGLFSNQLERLTR